jgi:hypothetical protein
MDRILSVADFKPHVGGGFRVRPQGESAREVPLILMEAKEQRQAGMVSFSLLFKGGSAAEFFQDTHVLEHPTLGPLEVFLGPVQTLRNDAVYYQAVFNRLEPSIAGRSEHV